MRWYQPFLYLWAAPATLLGLSLVPLALWQGGKVGVVRGVVEVHGGIITRLLKGWMPWIGSVSAMTLGHVIWGSNADSLRASREHEHVHVRQYERWGPFFLPAYLLASAYLWSRGRDPYRDNPFEREAFGRSED